MPRVPNHHKYVEHFFNINCADEVLNRIEAGSYLENKIRHNEFLKDNPFVAKKKFINLH